MTTQTRWIRAPKGCMLTTQEWVSKRYCSVSIGLILQPQSWSSSFSFPFASVRFEHFSRAMEVMVFSAEPCVCDTGEKISFHSETLNRILVCIHPSILPSIHPSIHSSRLFHTCMYLGGHARRMGILPRTSLISRRVTAVARKVMHHANPCQQIWSGNRIDNTHNRLHQQAMVQSATLLPFGFLCFSRCSTSCTMAKMLRSNSAATGAISAGDDVGNEYWVACRCR